MHVEFQDPQAHRCCQSTFKTADMRLPVDIVVTVAVLFTICEIFSRKDVASALGHLQLRSVTYGAVVVPIDVKNVFYVFYSCHVFNVF